ncbi:MAG: hypothetical protein ACXWN9_12145, partial [Candidatus Binataceae bacterium]
IARLGWSWRQPDVGYLAICLLEKIGLANDVRRLRQGSTQDSSQDVGRKVTQDVPQNIPQDILRDVAPVSPSAESA